QTSPKTPPRKTVPRPDMDTTPANVAAKVSRLDSRILPSRNDTPHETISIMSWQPSKGGQSSISYFGSTCSALSFRHPHHANPRSPSRDGIYRHVGISIRPLRRASRLLLDNRYAQSQQDPSRYRRNSVAGHQHHSL